MERVRQLIALVFVLTLIPVFVKPASAEDFKIGYINLGKTFDEYKKTQTYEKKLGSKGDNKEKEREKLVQDIRGLKEEMVLLSEKGKEEKQTLVDEKIKTLQDFDRDTRDELRQERDDMIREILEEINKIIQDYGKKNGYTVILNDRVVIYGNEAIDITQDIIDILNK
ncbi:MAG: OmpH family outer membrane protein [Candidatus Omnitrophica bacterium]|nr:OmpH family outer membrane protein [Candidatus Omnitrophota bacterium]